jgi:hypothetical protein
MAEVVPCLPDAIPLRRSTHVWVICFIFYSQSKANVISKFTTM